MHLKCFHLLLASFTLLGGVYMRKLAPAQVLYRHDFLNFVLRLHDDWVISHMISLFEGTLHVDKMHV